MSIPAFAWAIEMGRAYKLCPDDRCLLMVLANMADKQGECFPLQTTLTADTGLPKRTLIRSTQRLEAAGLIRTEVTGRRQTYRIERHVNGATVAPNGSGNGATQAPVRVGKSATVAPVNGATQAPVKQRLVPNLHAKGATVAPGTCFPPTPPFIPVNQEEEPRKKDSPQTPLVPRGAVRVSPLEDQSNPKPESPSRQDRHAYPADFEAFWLAYPRKAGKRAALKGWAGAVVRAGGASAIMAGLHNHRFSAEERFIPHPATWLNRDQWLDEADSFDPVMRAVGLTPEDFADWPVPEGRLLQ